MQQDQYRILITDDEYLIRKGLRYTIPWEELGFRVTEEAASAEEALRLLETMSIEVALVDIRMPGMSGLEFIGMLRERYPHIRTVIISGHEDFAYSVQALKMQVSDYLVKPVNRQTAIDAFRALKERLDEERQRQSLHQARGQAAAKRFFQRVLDNDFLNEEEMMAASDALGLMPVAERACVLCAHAPDLQPLLAERFEGSRSRCESTLDEWTREALDLAGMAEAPLHAVLGGSHYCVVLPQESAGRVAELLAERFAQERVPLRIGIGRPVERGNLLQVSYLQAVEAIAACRDDRAICRFTGQDRRNALEPSRRAWLERQAIERMEAGNREALHAWVDRLFSEFRDVERSEAVAWCIRSLYGVMDYFCVGSLAARKPVSDFDILSLSSAPGLDALRDGYESKLLRVLDLLGVIRTGSVEEHVRRVMEIAQNEYRNPELSLQEIANRLHISYGYLCTIFKQVTGENFTVWLTSLKMAKARAILLQEDVKMQEVAERVGYSSARYFTEQFRKQYGVAPGQYRQRFANE